MQEPTWRDYVDARFKALHDEIAMHKDTVDAMSKAQKEAVLAALNAAEQAVAKAEAASEKRFESVNEFRAALGDQTRTFMPRIEAEGLFANHDKRLNQVSATLTEKIEELSRHSNARDDRGRGAYQNWTTITSVVAVLAALVSMFIAVTK